MKRFSAFTTLHYLILSCKWRPQNSLPKVQPSAAASCQAITKPACRQMGKSRWTRVDLTNFLQAAPWLRITASRRTWILRINHISSISQYILCQVPILSTNTLAQQLATFWIAVPLWNCKSQCDIGVFQFCAVLYHLSSAQKRICVTVGVPCQA